MKGDSHNKLSVSKEIFDILFIDLELEEEWEDISDEISDWVD